MINELAPYENSFKKVYGTDEKVLGFQYKRYSDLIKKHAEYFDQWKKTQRIPSFSFSKKGKRKTETRNLLFFVQNYISNF